MTPLIDVAFQLIIFFILAGSFASLDVVHLMVPTLYGDRPIEVMRLPDKVVINVPPYSPAEATARPGEARAWLLSGLAIRPGDTGGLLRRLQRERQSFAASAGGGRDLQVEVRADRSIDFSDVAPVLSAVAQAGFQRVHYVAYASDDDR